MGRAPKDGAVEWCLDDKEVVHMLVTEALGTYQGAPAANDASRMGDVDGVEKWASSVTLRLIIPHLDACSIRLIDSEAKRR